jgi:ATP-dependent helicase/DNAse subunit B
MEPRDEGTLLHAMLERFVSAQMARAAWPPSGAPLDLAEARGGAEEVLRRFEREGRTGDPAAWAGRRAAVLHRLDRIVRAEVRDHDGLTPRLLEHAFGGDAPSPPLELSSGGDVVRLRGRIDRVDAGPDRLLVIDYKNSRGTEDHEAALDPDSFGVESFQVPAYLMAAAREVPGARRLEATFALLRRATRLDAVGLDAADPRLAPAAPAGSPSFAAAVVDRVGRMRAGDFPLASLGCERCPFGAVCRFEGLAARAAEEAG